MPFDVNHLPPGGWEYEEKSINWEVPNPFLPFNMVVDQIRKARANNPWAGLGLSWDAAASSLKTATTARMVTVLPGDMRWSGVGPNGSEVVIKKRRCATCRKK